MKLSSALRRGTYVLLAVLCFGAAHAAFADDYTIYQLDNANDRYLVGLTASGEAVIADENCGGFGSITCFKTYENGVEISSSLTAPTLTYDDGTGCAGPSGFDLSGEEATCNDGRTAFYSRDNPNNRAGGLYIGTPTDLSNISSLTSDGFPDGYLNASGDYLFVDGNTEFIYEAVDTSVATTPEPSGLLLLGTGVMSVAGMVRRRVVRG